MTDQQRIAEIKRRYAGLEMIVAGNDVQYLLSLLAGRDAEIERLREAQRWRELEVDPCGDIGTKALLYGIGGIDEGEYLGEGEWQVAYGSCPGETFTHWMPLPAPPEEGGTT